jgi:hypothetical protein
MAKDYGDLGTHLVEVEGLEPLVGEGRCRQARLLALVEAADRDDRDGLGLRVDLFEKPDAVLTRHDEVGEDDVHLDSNGKASRAVDTAMTLAPSKVSVVSMISRLSSSSSTTRILIPASEPSGGGMIVILVHSTCNARPAVTRHPDDRPLDAAVQVAAAAVLGEEGVQLGQHAHRRGE